MKSGVLEVFDSAIFQIIFCSFFFSFLLNQKEKTRRCFSASSQRLPAFLPAQAGLSSFPPHGTNYIWLA